MAQRGIEAADAERLSDEKRVQVQHQQSAVARALAIQRLEALPDHLPIPVYVDAPVPERVDIVERKRDRQRVQLPLRDLEGI